MTTTFATLFDLARKKCDKKPKPTKGARKSWSIFRKEACNARLEQLKGRQGKIVFDILQYG